MKNLLYVSFIASFTQLYSMEYANEFIPYAPAERMEMRQVSGVDTLQRELETQRPEQRQGYQLQIPCRKDHWETKICSINSSIDDEAILKHVLVVAHYTLLMYPLELHFHPILIVYDLHQLRIPFYHMLPQLMHLLL